MFSIEENRITDPNYLDFENVFDLVGVIEAVTLFFNRVGLCTKVVESERLYDKERRMVFTIAYVAFQQQLFKLNNFKFMLLKIIF